MKKLVLFMAFILTGMISEISAQAGIAVTPGRAFYKLQPGAEGKQVIKVTNPTRVDLEVGVSFSDWDYNENGGNNIQEAGTLEVSCTDWIQVLPDTFFILSPGETRDIEIVMNVPADADKDIPVRTSMVFFTQLNPGGSTAADGAAIQVTVRMGVKVYHSFEQQSPDEIDIVDFKKYTEEDNKNYVDLHLKNIGKMWTNGVVNWEILNKGTGKKTKLPVKEFYTLPNDLRVVKQSLPEDMESGDYTISAIVTYGQSDVINIAEMDFSI
jgi:P pilus assembly chaperone PapD